MPKKLIIIKDTIDDFNKYNEDYFKPCKLYYKIGNKYYKCPYCYDNYKEKFLIKILKK